MAEELKYQSVNEYHHGEFRRLHEEGSEEFNVAWITINEVIADSVMGMPEWDYSDVDNKHALTRAAMAVLKFMKEHAMLDQDCRHRIVIVNNDIVKHGAFCVDCGGVFSEYTGPKLQATPEGLIPIMEEKK